MNFNNWKRIMLKLSGEVLVGNQDYGIDPDISKKDLLSVQWIPGG